MLKSRTPTELEEFRDQCRTQLTNEGVVFVGTLEGRALIELLLQNYLLSSVDKDELAAFLVP